MLARRADSCVTYPVHSRTFSGEVGCVRGWIGGLCLLLLVALGQAGSRVAPPTGVAAVSAAPLTAHDNDNDVDEDDDSLDQFVDETIDAANDFWAGVLKERGKAYRAPAVIKAYSSQRIRSKCGKSRGAEHSYCAEDETVFLDMDSDDPDAFETLWDEDRSFIIVTTMSPQ
jgi:predicted metalloprotease